MQLKKNILNYTYRNSVIKTPYDNMQIDEIINKSFYLFKKGVDPISTYQAFHNIYAKKLKIPSLRLEREEDLETVAVFNYIYSNKDVENVVISIEEYAEYTDGILDLFSYVIHETKHAHQSYLLHNFIHNNVVPQNDYEKLLILNMLLTRKETNMTKLGYYKRVNELDAYIYEFKESFKLQKESKYFNNIELKMHQKASFDKILINLSSKNSYKKKYVGLIKNKITKDVELALNGKYGLEIQNKVEDILKSNLNIDNAINDLINKLEELEEMFDKEQEKTP